MVDRGRVYDLNDRAGDALSALLDLHRRERIRSNDPRVRQHLAAIAREDPHGFREMRQALNYFVSFGLRRPARAPMPTGVRRSPRRRGAGRPAARRTVAVRGGDSGDDDPGPQDDPPPWRSDRCPCCLAWRMWRGGELVCINGACPEYGL